jgi:hypothetical protein
VGPDQDGFLDFYARHVIPKVVLMAEREGRASACGSRDCSR